MVAFAVVEGVDVRPAGENDAVQLLDLPFDDVKIRHAGDDDGHAASRRNSPEINAIITAKP